MKVFLNGQIIEEKDAKISVADHGFLYGDAVFETLRYKDGEIINIKKHLKRLQHSASKVMLQLPNIDIEKTILQLVQENSLEEARIRITLSRGVNHFDFTTCENPTLLITAVPYPQKRQNFFEGTKTCSIRLERPVPDIKTTQILPSILAHQKAHKMNCDECFFVDHTGQITEGSYSNFFAVKEGIIHTPPANVCLEGTIRKTLFELCKKEGIDIREKEILYKDLPEFDELFWTNAVVHIAPIKELDEIRFKAPGEVTGNLMGLLKEYT